MNWAPNENSVQVCVKQVTEKNEALRTSVHVYVVNYAGRGF